MGRRWKVLIAVGLSLLAADQITKYLAVRHLTPGIAQQKSGAQVAPDPAKTKEILQEVGFLEGFGYFYGSVKHPCRVPGARCAQMEVTVVDGFWNHRYVENPGAAWGVLRSAPESVRVPFFFLISVGAVIFILSLVRKLDDNQWAMIIAFSLVMGGAMGNFIDRLHLSYVVDFIDWYAGTYHWPTFNVADAGITSGVILMMLEWIREGLTKRGEGESGEPAESKSSA